MKSILQEKTDRCCFLCMVLHGDDSRKLELEEHHVIYGRGKRPLSEKYGLKVYLCPPHHRDSPEAIHHNTKGDKDIDDVLKQAAQIAFKTRFPKLDFVEIFGKNYIDEKSLNPCSSSTAKSQYANNAEIWEKPSFILQNDEEPIDF